MQRFLFTLFVALALVFSAVGAAPAAHAADCTAEGQSCTPSYGGTGTCVSDDSGGLTCTPSVGTVINIDSATQRTVIENKTSTDEAYNGIMSRIMSLFAWLVGVAAVTLDYAVYYTVVVMGDYVHNLTAVGVTWRILRDIGNIFLIFGFLAAGIMTILNTTQYGWGKQMLPMLLVAAVFLNFSLFISEAIIDTGNLFATQFYTQIKGGSLPEATYYADPDFLGKVEREGISNKIMSQLGLTNIYGIARSNTEVFEGGAPWFIGFMGILLFLITAFVLFSLAFILIARFVILLFLIIVAPIGFAGWAVPKLSALSSQYWSKLFEQTITAPVLLLLFYVALTIITDAQFLTGFGADKDWTGFLQSSSLLGGSNLGSFASMMLSFLVAMGLLLVVVIASKRLSAFGGEGATKLAGKLSFGLTAASLRTTAGFGSQYLSRKLRDSKFGRVPIVGRSLAGVLDRGAKASFDVRGSGVFKKIPFGSQIDMGKAQEGGYAEREKKAIEGREKYAASLTGKEQTQKEKDAIAAAETKKKEAGSAKDTAKEDSEAATRERDRQKAEVARLTAKDSENRQKGIFNDTQTRDALKAAQQNLAVSEAGVSAADDKLARAKADLAKRTEEEAKIRGDILARTGSAKEAQEAYAKNIQWGPGKILFRNRKAAENIIRNAGKSSEARTIDALMDQIKKASASTTGPAPATTPPPAAANP